MALSSCRTNPPVHVIARVGNTELTMEEAAAVVDATHGGSRDEQLSAYIASWITNELLYQEAQRAGIEEQSKFKDRLGAARHQLAIQLLLQDYFAADSAAISEDTLRGYYLQHAGEFLVQSNMIRLHLAVFPTRERASAFAAAVLRGTEWNAARGTDTANTTLFPPQYYTQHTLYPPELWRIASTLSTGDVSFPIKIPVGYAIVQPLAFVKEGKSAEFEMVRDEVQQRVQLQRRRRRYDELLGTLRKRTTVEVVLPSPPSHDTTEIHIHE